MALEGNELNRTRATTASTDDGSRGRSSADATVNE
jgi:hypothetical protein